MGTGSIERTDLYILNNYVQNTMISDPKSILLETLRNFFETDSYYHYVRDQFGFALTPDHTDLPLDAGLNDDTTTRVYIGQQNRYDVIFLPAILIRYGGGRSVPISMSRDKESLQWSNTIYTDGYGTETIISTPSHFIQCGAWEGQIIIDVETRSLQARDELIQLISLMLVDLRFEDLVNSGIVIKNLSQGSPSEGDDRNDKLFKQSITLDVRTEWRRHIPVANVLDTIFICIEFGNLARDPVELAPNLKISNTVELVDAITGL